MRMTGDELRTAVEQYCSAAYPEPGDQKKRELFIQYICHLEANRIKMAVSIMPMLMLEREETIEKVNFIGNLLEQSPVAAVLNQLEGFAIAIVGGEKALPILIQSEFMFDDWAKSCSGYFEEGTLKAGIAQFTRLHSISLYMAGYDDFAKRWACRGGNKPDKVLLYMAKQCAAAGNMIDAKKWAERMSEDCSWWELFECRVILMQAAHASGRMEDALAHFSDAWQVAADHERRYELAKAALKCGFAEQARLVCEGMKVRERNWHYQALGLARCEAVGGNVERAAELLAKVWDAPYEDSYSEKLHMREEVIVSIYDMREFDKEGRLKALGGRFFGEDKFFARLERASHIRDYVCDLPVAT